MLSALEKHYDKVARAAMSEHLAAGAVSLTDHLIRRGVVAEASGPDISAAEARHGPAEG